MHVPIDDQLMKIQIAGNGTYLTAGRGPSIRRLREPPTAPSPLEPRDPERR